MTDNLKIRKETEKLDIETQYRLDKDRAERKSVEEGWKKQEVAKKIGKQKTTLAEVHTVIKKWLFLSDDTIIDVLLAVYLTSMKAGTKVWIIIVDQSGDTKSELLRALKNLENVIVIHNINANAFVSGKEGAHDLYYQLVRMKNAVIIISDLAILTSKNPNEKNEIWAIFRDLYDGILHRRTGLGVKGRDDFQITMLAAGTPRFRAQYIIANQLGTRELLYTPRQRSKHLKEKLRKASENDNYEEQMRKEIAKIVEEFLSDTLLTTIPKLDNDVSNFLDEQCMRLRLLRATADIDWYHYTIKGEIDIETPTRAKKQFKRIWEALLSLDKGYSVDRAKKIISRIVDSSGSQLRMKIMERMENNAQYTAYALSDTIRVSQKMVIMELEMLWQMEWLLKETKRDEETHQLVTNYWKPAEVKPVTD